MKFNNHFLLLNYIITNYDKLNTDLILVSIDNKKENFTYIDEYIMWHAQNIGTNINTYKLISSKIPLKNILQKPKNYYYNILIKNKLDFLELSFHDIFFEKIKICIVLTGFMRNFNNTLSIFKNFFKNYQLDYYLVTYDIIGYGNRESENYSQNKFNIDELKKIIPIKKYIIKEYSKCDKISEDIALNKFFHQTSNIYDGYNLIDENYLFYIRMRPDLEFQNLDEILNNYFIDIINNKVLVHGIKEIQNNDYLIEKSYYPFDGFAICSIFTAEIYFNFHLTIHNFNNNTEETLYKYLLEKNINIIFDNICKIDRSRQFGSINRNVIMSIRGKK